jgi:hypothetical protein
VAYSERKEMEQGRGRTRRIPKGKSRIPEKSTLYTKVIPVLLIGMTILMTALILVAAGILTGLIPYN